MGRTCALCKASLDGRHSVARYCVPCSVEAKKAGGAAAARMAVAAAVRKGLLPHIKTTVCVDCGAPGQEYDHRDYGKPLDVEPVCRSCNTDRGPAKPAPGFPDKGLWRPSTRSTEEAAEAGSA